MSNSLSPTLTEWAALASNVKSPVAANLASLLRSMSQLSDAELLSLELPVFKQKVTVWDSTKHEYNDALDLPEGTLVVGFFQVDVKPETLHDAVVHLKVNSNGSSWQARTQAEIIKKAFPDTYR